MLALLLGLRCCGDILLRFLRRQAHLLDDRVGASFDPAAIVGWLLLEVRKNCLSRMIMPDMASVMKPPAP